MGKRNGGWLGGREAVYINLGWMKNMTKRSRCTRSFFFAEKGPTQLSPAIEASRPCLAHLHSSLSEGFSPERSSRRSTGVKRGSNRRQRRAERLGSGAVPTPVLFDNETLGGYVAISEPSLSLKGELEVLITRYAPKTGTV